MKLDAVFEGGGVKAIGIVGAVKIVEERGFQWNRLAGTSSGAIVATLLKCGYKADEIKEIITSISLDTMLAANWFFRLPIVGAFRMLFKKGLYSGDLIEQWIERLVAAKGIRTFGDLEKDSLRIIASDISEGRLLVLPDDLPHYGISIEDFPISKAVRMSMSIPYYFDPIVLSSRDDMNRVDRPSFVVDGALLSNYPIWLFDDEEDEKEPEWPIFGFNLYGKSEKRQAIIKGPFDMLQALFSTMLDARDQRYIERLHSVRTIFIPTLGVRTTDFSLSEQMKERLYESGKNAAKQFLQDWSFSSYKKQVMEEKQRKKRSV